MPVATASAAVMEALSPVQSASPVVALAERPIGRTRARARIYGGTPLVVVAVDVQDPGNVGAIVRVAEAGGATGVVCAGACADPFGWKALRGSMGSALRLPISSIATRREAIDEARATAAASWRRCRAAAGRCSTPTSAGRRRARSAAKAPGSPRSQLDAAPTSA